MSTSSRAVQMLLVQTVRRYSSAGVKHYQVVVAGGGSGGCAVAARACRALGSGKVAVIDPAQVTIIKLYAFKDTLFNFEVFSSFLFILVLIFITSRSTFIRKVYF